MVDTSKWKEFKLTGKNGLFKIESCKCKNASEILEDGNDIEYLGAKKNNNGFMRYVKYNENFITKGNCIIFICDGQGSVGYANYIDHDFIGSTTLSVGYNKHLNANTGMFIVTVLDLERYRYSFGRKYTVNLPKVKIKLPATIYGKPNWEYMSDFIDNIKNVEKQNKESLRSSLETKNQLDQMLNINGWEEFKLKTLFGEIYKAEAHVKGELILADSQNKNSIALVTRTEENNACDCYVINTNLTGIEEGNAIIIGDTTATIFYQNQQFVAGDHIVVCRASWLNKYTASFLKVILEKDRYRYSYGRAFKKDLIENTVVKLPVKNKEPDWEYIEKYMQSIPYADRL